MRAATCRQITVRRDGEIVEVEVQANAFLHHMVRNIVGSLLMVGRGEQPEAWIARAAGRPRPHRGRADGAADWPGVPRARDIRRNRSSACPTEVIAVKPKDACSAPASSSAA